MLFEPIVRELVVFYVFLFGCIPQENYIFPNMSAVSSLFLLLKKGSCKNRNETAKRLKWRIFFFYKQMFFDRGVWKTSKRGETFIRCLWHLIVLTEITIQSSAVAVKWSLEVCIWVSCWWEEVYDLIYSKTDLAEESYAHEGFANGKERLWTCLCVKFFSNNLFHEI